ncbi:MAG: hypothetical protein QOG75_5692, partial [Mycobacterium sp.]|nr:hypothetical protein [Mycobacterium sp.]
ELAEQLYRDRRSVAVILISTHAEQDFADMIAASPAVGFLCKSALSPGAIRDLLGGRDDDDAAGGVNGPEVGDYREDPMSRFSSTGMAEPSHMWELNSGA